MHADSQHRRITHLEFKYEGETKEGFIMGKLTDQDGYPVFADGRWVTKTEALRIARDLHVEMSEY